MEPLASKIRPKTLEEFIGQEHLVGPGKPLSTAIKEEHVFSFILWGPPGAGSPFPAGAARIICIIDILGFCI